MHSASASTSSVSLAKRSSRFTVEKRSFWTVQCAYHEQRQKVENGNDDGDQYGDLPAVSGRVRGGDEKVTSEVEHVKGGRQRAPELRLAHFAAVRYAQPRGKPRAQAHQHRAQVQVVDGGGEQHHDEHASELHEIGERHAHPVAQPRLDQRQDQASHGRWQVNETSWNRWSIARYYAGFRTKYLFLFDFGQ